MPRILPRLRDERQRVAPLARDRPTQADAHRVGRRARTLLVELASGWLRLQPGREIVQWFNKRFACEGARLRRVGILALARRLAIALWYFLQDSEIPVGAQLKVIQA